MPEKRDALDSVRLDESAARRLIERATELDARLASESSIADLREAARGAGISDEAFQRALAEVRQEQAPPTDAEMFDITRNQPWRRVAVALVVGLLAAAALMFARLRPVPIEPRTPPGVEQAAPARAAPAGVSASPTTKKQR